MRRSEASLNAPVSHIKGENDNYKSSGRKHSLFANDASNKACYFIGPLSPVSQAVYHFNNLQAVILPYLIGTGDVQPVEKRDKDLGRDSRHDGIGETKQPEGSSKPVSLCRCANDSDA